MNLNDERYFELAEKWLNGTITPEEEEEYARWYNSLGPDNVLEIPVEHAVDREAYRKKILQQINRKRRGGSRLRKRRYGTITTVILILCSGIYLYVHRLSSPRQSLTGRTQVESIEADIRPGTQGAVLTLSDGHTIVLDTAGNGSLARTAGANIVKSESSVSFYASRSGTPYTPEYNLLMTPRGRQQQLVLADGTKVWLNAGSSIRFPSAFTGKERAVIIKGEAYFEVVKNPLQPFVVQVNDASVEVLGTHFNVMAYENEPAMETTLLEGAVKLRSGEKTLLLKPGQQSRLLADGDLRLVSNADVELAIAWKNGMQAYDRSDLKAIMRQVERWYDVDVEYQGEIPVRTFSGEIPRNANLSELLGLFKAANIHFSIDADRKKLTVMP